MGGLRVEIPPTSEPVLLPDMKNYLKVRYPDDDALISLLITAARELIESFTARSICNKGYVQTLDSFPYYTDTVMSQLAFPPSYYSLPKYSTTLWNYSQMIKLYVSPLISITNIAYLSSDDLQWHSLVQGTLPWYPNAKITVGYQCMDINANIQQALNALTSGFNPPPWNGTKVGNVTVETTGQQWQNMGPTALNELGNGNGTSNTFFADTICEPPRIFPGPAGSVWPPVLYVPDAVQVHFVAGHGNYTPASLMTALLQLVAGWYQNRESISPLSLKEMPNHVRALLWSKRVLDLSPTRG